ncbi:MAG: hypothetical protein WBE77_04555, partial [Candidatus Cybelea sp.]
DGGSEEAEQQERNLEGGATSGSEALCHAATARDIEASHPSTELVLSDTELVEVESKGSG